MDCLNSAIMESFIFCPVVNSFLQSISDHYLFCLLYRDERNIKTNFLTKLQILRSRHFLLKFTNFKNTNL